MAKNLSYCSFLHHFYGLFPFNVFVRVLVIVKIFNLRMISFISNFNLRFLQKVEKLVTSQLNYWIAFLALIRLPWVFYFLIKEFEGIKLYFFIIIAVKVGLFFRKFQRVWIYLILLLLLLRRCHILTRFLARNYIIILSIFLIWITILSLLMPLLHR